MFASLRKNSNDGENGFHMNLCDEGHLEWHIFWSTCNQCKHLLRFLSSVLLSLSFILNLPQNVFTLLVNTYADDTTIYGHTSQNQDDSSFAADFSSNSSMKQKMACNFQYQVSIISSSLIWPSFLQPQRIFDLSTRLHTLNVYWDRSLLHILRGTHTGCDG